MQTQQVRLLSRTSVLYGLLLWLSSSCVLLAGMKSDRVTVEPVPYAPLLVGIDVPFFDYAKNKAECCAYVTGSSQRDLIGWPCGYVGFQCNAPILGWIAPTRYFDSIRWLLSWHCGIKVGCIFPEGEPRLEVLGNFGATFFERVTITGIFALRDRNISIKLPSQVQEKRNISIKLPSQVQEKVVRAENGLVDIRANLLITRGYGVELGLRYSQEGETSARGDREAWGAQIFLSFTKLLSLLDPLFSQPIIGEGVVVSVVFFDELALKVRLNPTQVPCLQKWGKKMKYSRDLRQVHRLIRCL